MSNCNMKVKSLEIEMQQLDQQLKGQTRMRRLGAQEVEHEEKDQELEKSNQARGTKT